jgi:acetylglutamate kinase
MIKVDIVKIGSNIVNNPEVLDAFLEDFAKHPGLKILVHGGGSTASALSKKLDIPVQMVAGRRITDADSLDVVTMVYAGLINKSLVAKLQALNCNAFGLTGADGNTILSHKRKNAELDFGFVGDIDWVNVAGIKGLFDAGMVPVFAPITHDAKGQLLNTNADTIAAQLAMALKEYANVNLIYIFEKEGVLKDVNDDDSVIPTISASYYKELKNQGIVSDGMIPKLDNCFDALEKGVQKITIGSPAVLNPFQEKKTELVW